MANEDLEKYKNEMAHKRRVITQARAIIQRGRTAGIPQKYLRIPQKDFLPLLCPHYHKRTKEFAEMIYTRPKGLFNKPFIVIDGGNMYSRKMAGFAILFRMIACDKHGKYYDCGQLASEFQTIKFNGSDNRNDLVKRIKKEQILFINEFHHKKFNIHFDSGNFFDQLLEYRDDYSKPTIITFTSPLQNGVHNAGNALKDDRCGSYLSMLSQADMEKNPNVFRIKLK